MSRARELQAFVEEHRDPVVWSVSDCTAWARAWVKRASGIVVPALSYRTRDEAKALIKREGGLPAIWSRALGEAGIMETGAPVLGDIGIIGTHLYGPIGVIYAEGGIALMRREEGGFAAIGTAHRTLIAAWAVP